MKQSDVLSLILISACLTACTSPSSPSPSPSASTPPSPSTADESQRYLSNALIEIGYRQEATISLPAGYSWRTLSTPPWLHIEKSDASDRMVLHVDRDKAADRNTRVAKLQGPVEMYWASNDGARSGKAKWDISFAFYRVSGRIAPPSSSGQDLRFEMNGRAPITGQAAGSVLSFRSPVDAASFVARTRKTSSGGTALSTLQLRGVTFSRLGSSSVLMNGPELNQRELASLSATPGEITVTANARLTELGDPVPALPVEPADPFYANQWQFKTLGYPAVWRDMETGAYKNSVVIALIDSGIRYDHPDLGAALLPGIEGAIDLLPADVSDDGDGVDTDPTDPNFFGRTRGSHGTHVAGIMVAGWDVFTAPCSTCSNRGVAGAAYRAPIRLLPIRAIDARGNTDIATITTGVLYAAGLPIDVEGHTYVNPHPAQIINLSLGGPIDKATAAPLCDAIETVHDRGVLVVAAAGNTGDERVHYPAACPSAVAVGSLTLTNGGQVTHSSFSSHYAAVRLSAPGGGPSDLTSGKTYFNGSKFNDAPFPDDILSTDWDYAQDLPVYSTMIGTSQATPQVSVLAALLLSKGVASTPEQALNRIEQTATDLGTPGRDGFYGSGMINPRAALDAPAISERYGVTFRRDDGNVYSSEVENSGTFEAFLPSGTFDMTVGSDRNANRIYGEYGEKSAAQRIQLGSTNFDLTLGEIHLSEHK